MSDRDQIEAALAAPDRLISYDRIRLQALRARLASDRSGERRFLAQLTEAFPFRKEYHYEFAESYFHGGEGAEAVAHYLKALEIDPDYNLAHNHIAYCYAWHGKHDLAERHLKKYVDLDDTANAFDSLAANLAR